MKRWRGVSAFRPDQSGLQTVLGPLETAIMEVLWEGAPMTVREVHERLPRSEQPAYTTVMTVMHRLHEKGLVKRRHEGAAHRYRPALGRKDFEEGMVALVLSGLLTDFPEITREHVRGLRRRHRAV